jgi:DnaA-homolog protein
MPTLPVTSFRVLMTDPALPLAPQLTLDVLAVSPPRLENFTAGPNIELLEYLHKLQPDSCPLNMCPIYIWGAPGSGKSHLIQALQARSIQCVDDVHTLDDPAQDNLFAQINQARSQGRALVAAGSSPPRLLPLREDVRSRLAWGLSLECHALSDEDKAVALARMGHDRGLELGSELIDYLLTRTARDMRALASLIEQLDQYSLALKRALTIPLLRQYLAQRFAPVE